jgi:flagellar hook-associated protein 3 FlgL
MTDRITNAAMSNRVQTGIQAALRRMATYQEQLSSGKRLNRLSDDPAAAKQTMGYRSDQAADAKYLDNIQKSLAFMGASDSAFSEMSTTLDQVKQLAVQGANGSQDAASRRALATSVDSLLTRLVDLANTVHDNRFIFAGTATQTQPFAIAADRGRVDYRGNLDTFEVRIGASATVTVNQNGYELFKGGNDVFNALIDLREALEANDPQAVNLAIPTIDTIHDRINNLQGSMGGRVSRLELTQDQLENAKVFLGGLISQAEDIDLPDTISKMQLTQVALEAGLQAGARALQPSLLDFLR